MQHWPQREQRVREPHPVVAEAVRHLLLVTPLLAVTAVIAAAGGGRTARSAGFFVTCAAFAVLSRLAARCRTPAATVDAPGHHGGTRLRGYAAAVLRRSRTSVPARPEPALVELRRSCGMSGADAVEAETAALAGRTDVEPTWFPYLNAFSERRLLHQLQPSSQTRAVALGVALTAWVAFGALVVLLGSPEMAPLAPIFAWGLTRQLAGRTGHERARLEHVRAATEASAVPGDLAATSARRSAESPR